MFLLFGVKDKEIDHGPVLPVVCPNCHNQTWMRLVEIEKWAAIFFIPIAPYDGSYMLACDVCSRGIELTEKQFERAKKLVRAAKAMHKERITAERYKEIVERSRLLPSPDQRMVRLKPKQS
jgi:hypothetical protein